MRKILTQKSLKLFLLTTLVVILALTFTACDLFSFDRKVSKVSIEIGEGLVDSNKDGVYEIECGKEFTLDANWHYSIILSPSIKWYVQAGEGNKTEIKDCSVKTLSYKFTEVDNVVYSFFVVVDGISSLDYSGDASNQYKSIKVIAKYANLSTTSIEITSSTHTIVQNVIQMDLNTSLSNIKLNANWNKEALPSEWTVICRWYVDSEIFTGEEYTYDISSYNSSSPEQNKTIKVELFSTSDSDRASASLTIAFIKEYKAVDSVSIAMASSGLTKVSSVTYYKEGKDECSVNINAVVTPSTGTKLTNPCVWTRRASNGDEILTVTGREATIPLKYGKNIIRASIDNVESRTIIVYLLTSEHYNARKYAINETYIWKGYTQDQYINNQEDLNDLFGYMASKHVALDSDGLGGSGAYSIYIAPSEWNEWNSYDSHLENFKNALKIAASVGLDESGTFSYIFNERKIGFNECPQGTPVGPCESIYTTTQENIYNSLTERVQTRTLAIDKSKDTLNVANSNELYRAVSNGYKPVIDEENSDLISLYSKAREVLNTYVTDSMTDLEKVKTIYEWIVTKVTYDKAAVNSTSENKSLYNAFSMEGVFFDKRAVCDGKSKAFALLCGMEGIKAVRVVGFANENLANQIAIWAGKGATESQIMQSLSSTGWGHAWNKVLVDANGDNIKEWYVVDTTWGDLSIGTGYSPKEYLTYDYFLVTDKDIERTHISYQTQYNATTAFNAYDYISVYHNDVNNTMYITSVEQINNIISYSKAHGSVKFVIVDPKGIVNASNKSLNSRTSYSSLSGGSKIVWYN